MGKNAIVGQSGGPTSVINASLAGVFESCKNRGADIVYGMCNGVAGLLEERVVDLSTVLTDDLVRATVTLMYYASQRKEIAGLSSSLQAEIPQLYFDVDRDKVKLAGVPDKADGGSVSNICVASRGQIARLPSGFRQSEEYIATYQ